MGFGVRFSRGGAPRVVKPSQAPTVQLPSHDRGAGRDRVDSLHVHFERVLRKDDEVRQQPRPDDADLSLPPELRGAVHRIARQRLLQRNPGVPRRHGGRIGPAQRPSGHAHFDADERAHPQRVVNDIAGQRHVDPFPHELPDELRPAGPLRPHVDLPGVPICGAAKPVRREVGVHAQLLKACDVAVGHREQMTYRDLDPQGPPQRVPSLLDRVETVPGRSIA